MWINIVRMIANKRRQSDGLVVAAAPLLQVRAFLGLKRLIVWRYLHP